MISELKINNSWSKNESSCQTELQNHFFSKDIISNLNKLILIQLAQPNLNRETKQQIINLLVKNMKQVYKAMDFTKINGNNYHSIIDQFKRHSLSETLNEISTTNILGDQILSSSDLKFNRDFNSNLNVGNKVVDRPLSTREFSSKLNTNAFIQSETYSIPQATFNPNIQISDQSDNSHSFMIRQPTLLNLDIENKISTHEQNFHGNLNTRSTLDEAFRPIINNTQDNVFNNYTSRKEQPNDIKLNDIHQKRQTEININSRPSTPDFLKTHKLNQNKENINNNLQNEYHSIPQNSCLEGLNESIENNMNSFLGLANDMGENLFSIDNIDKPLIDVEIVEDDTKFEDRLKQLKQERDNLKPIQENKNIDFTSENFPKNSVDNIILLEKPIMKSINTEINDNRLLIGDSQKKCFMTTDKISIENSKEFSAEISPIINDGQKNKDFLPIKSSIISPPKTIPNINSQLFSTGSNQSSKNIYQDENYNHQKINENINNIKKKLQTELDTLKKKTLEYESKLHQLNLKEVSLIEKEVNVQKLLTNYDYLFKTKFLQLEVTNNENKSQYSWHFNNPLDNVICIKLLSYSLPIPRFNIEENINNILEYSINDEHFTIIIPSGKYTIDELIDTINKYATNITLSLDFEQKIILESFLDTDIINLYPTHLSTINLGFININSEDKISHKLIATQTWDLRINDKVYLYLMNIADDIPFGLLFYNGQSISQFRFENPFNLIKLDINFKDVYRNNINFNNLPHTLSFLIEQI